MTDYGRPQTLQYDLFGNTTDLPPDTLTAMNRDDRVAYILERYPETRDDDRELMLRYWQTFDALHVLLADAWPTFCDAFHKITHPETIRRGRAGLQKLSTDAGHLRPKDSTIAYRRARDGAGPPRS